MSEEKGRFVEFIRSLDHPRPRPPVQPTARDENMRQRPLQDRQPDANPFRRADGVQVSHDHRDEKGARSRSEESSHRRALTDNFRPTESRERDRHYQPDTHGAGTQPRQAACPRERDGKGLPEMPDSMSRREKRNAEKWFNDLKPADQRFYRNYLKETPESQRDRALTLMRKIDDRYVSSRQDKNALRDKVLDEGMGLSDREARFLDKFVLTDEKHKDQAVRRRHLESDHRGPQDHRHTDAEKEVAAYNSDNNRLMFSTNLLRRGQRVQSEIIGHEFTHPQADYRLSSRGTEKKDTQLYFGIELNKSYQQAAGSPQERRVTRALFQDLYAKQGYSEKEAADKARHAVANRDEYYACYQSLFQAGPEERSRLRAHDPGMANLVRRDANSTLPNDRQYVNNLDLGQFERENGMAPGTLNRFRGFQNDPIKRAALQNYLTRRAGAERNYSAGVQGSGTDRHRQPNPGTRDGLLDAAGRTDKSTRPVYDAGDAYPLSGYSSFKSTRPVYDAGDAYRPSGYSSSTTSGYSPTSSPPTSVFPENMPASHQTSADVVGNPITGQQSTDARPPAPLDTVTVSSNMVDLNRDGSVDAKDQQVYDKAVQSGASADAPDELLQKVLSTVARQRDGGDASPAEVKPFTRDTPEMRLLRGGPEAGLAEPRAATDMTPRVNPAARMLSRSEVEDVVGEAYKNLASGRARLEDLDGMASASASPDGAKRVADVLETVVTGPDGPRKLMDLMHSTAGNPEASRAFAATLANMVEATPTRTVGTLLLITDAPGGGEAVAKLFSAMASDKEGAIQLANFFARASRDPDAARGMGELLDTLTMPEDGDRTKSRQVAESFSNATRWVSGAQGMREGFTNLLDQEGGGRAFSRLMHRFSGTSEGAQSTAGLLRQMSYDREGTHAVSTMLSRATASRDGARQMLDAFNRIAATDAGKHDVAMLLNRISQVDGGSRVLANLTADNANVRGFSELMDKLSENEEARGRVSGALENIASGGPAAEVGRITARAQQNQELGDSLSRFNWGQPQVEASPEVRLTTEGFGAKLLAEQGAADSTALIGESARGVVAPGGEPPSKDSTLHPGMESLLKNISSAPEAKESRPRSEHPRVQEVRPAPIDGPRQLFTFRPGDVYSEDTLREARICPDCGFRLSPGGVCLRCVAFEQRAINPQQVQVARTQEIEPQG